MAKKVIIIEAPGKVSSFKKYVGKDYEVYPTVGHCVDLPIKTIGVDIKNDFAPSWEIKDDSEKTVQQIQKACKNADCVYLMTDEDREGEAIAFHIHDLIKNSCKGKIFRASTNQITKAGILKALENPGELDQSKINAYLARRILDRLAGYKTSYLTQQASGGRSAGRVQSAVLRIIVDREKEIIGFHPVEYWVLTAYLLSSKGDKYTAILSEKIEVPNEKIANQIYNNCIKSSPKISDIDSKEVDVKPWAPFTTMPMVSSAASILGWSAKKTMSVAQTLYTGGLCTYHRTDSPVMAPEAVQEIRSYLSHTLGDQYVPEKAHFYPAKKGAQEAHECCRPTVISTTPDNSSLSGDELKLYTLVWKRAIASQMEKARDRRIKVITKIADYDFISSGKIELFDGFRKIWDYSSSDDVVLPDLQVGEECTLKNLEREQKFTQAPPRYTDASLATFCEKKQITRPATVANVFNTLEQRKYVTKKKNTFHPTEMGIAVADFHVAADFCFVDVEFTAAMEEKLDEIQSGEKTEKDVLSEFWERLKKDIDNGKIIRDQNQVSEYKCPKCGAPLLKKYSQWGPFYTCSKSKKITKKQEKEGKKPECDYLAKVGKDGEPVEKKAAAPKEYADFKCKKCGSKMVKRKSKYGDFFGCEKFPYCKATADTEGVFKEPSKKKWGKKKKKTEDEE